MNGSARWKEDRIRERIYLEQLKHTETLPNGVGLNGLTYQAERRCSSFSKHLAAGARIEGRRITCPGTFYASPF